MTVRELKQKLEGVPDDLEVFLMQTDDESPYNMVHSVEVREITFEDPEEEYIPHYQLPRETILAITDEI